MKETTSKTYSLKEKFASLGPGILIVGSFIGPGTVTSATRAGANYGFALLWCIIFSVVAVSVLQEMAARLGVVKQAGLCEVMLGEVTGNNALRWALILIVAVPIVLGGFAYMGGDLTGTALGLSAITGVSTKIIAPVWGICIMLITTYYNIFTDQGTVASRVFFRIVAKAVRMRVSWPDVHLQGPLRP